MLLMLVCNDGTGVAKATLLTSRLLYIFPKQVKATVLTARLLYVMPEPVESPS